MTFIKWLVFTSCMAPTFVFGVTFTSGSSSGRLVLADEWEQEFASVSPSVFSRYFKKESIHIGDDRRFFFQKAILTKERDNKIRVFVYVRCDKSVRTFKITYKASSGKKLKTKKVSNVNQCQMGSDPFVRYCYPPPTIIPNLHYESYFGGYQADIWEF